MPMVFKDNIKYTDISTTIYGTYLSIYDKPEYDDKIIIETSSVINLNICKQGLYRKVYADNKSHLHIFEIPKEFEEDLYLVISGRYSWLSDEYKHKLLYFWSKDKDSKLFGILYKRVDSRFTRNEYLANKSRIDKADEYYIKPLYSELIYGLQI